MQKSLLCLLFLFLCLTSFSQKPHKERRKHFIELSPMITNENYCFGLYEKGAFYSETWYAANLGDTIVTDQIKNRFSSQVQSVATDISVLALLDEFVRLENQQDKNSLEYQFAFLKVRQEIDERIMLANLEVSGVLAEISCERDRTRELYQQLYNADYKRVTKLTIGSIVVGAIPTVIGSGLALMGLDSKFINPINVGYVSGAIISGYWAYRTLKVYNKALAKFPHRRNHLKDIWTNPEWPDAFPPTVWNYLTRELGNEQIVREYIIQKWKNMNIIAEGQEASDKKLQSIVFSEGGIYNASQAEARLKMLDILFVEVALMQEELKQLQQEMLLE